MNIQNRHIFECVDAYTEGNPVRLIKGPQPKLEGETMGEKRIYFIRHYDWIRTGLMFEPRGHDMMSGSFFCSVLNTRLVIENLVLLLVCCPKVFVVAALLQTRTGDSNGYVWRCKGANSFKSIECHRRMWS